MTVKPFGPRFSEWIPAIALMLIVVVAAGYCTVHQQQGGGGFSPVSVSPLRLLTPGPYHAGQSITIQAGICNNGSQPLQTSTVIGFVEQDKDRTTAINVVAVAPVSLVLTSPLAPGCSTEPAIRTLPPGVATGRWRLYINLTIMGTNSSDIQRVNVLSDVFEVVP
ncbi:MAG TPA: hypothetical protein VIP09_02160 [Dehalococcoidia bacterium]